VYNAVLEVMPIWILLHFSSESPGGEILMNANTRHKKTATSNHLDGIRFANMFPRPRKRFLLSIRAECAGEAYCPS
jgi:hypothetical protein